MHKMLMKLTQGILNDWGKPITSVPGRTEGLFFVLDAHSDLVGGVTVNSDFEGFTGFIDKRGSYPLPSSRGFQIRPGVNFTNI